MADRIIIPGETWPEPDFVVISQALKAVGSDSDFLKEVALREGDRVVIATASSTSTDLDSDRFTDAALEDMARGFSGLTIFLNHSYKLPLDIFGQVVRCALVQRDYLDLDLAIRVTNHNPAADQVYGMIRDGFQLGVSVGVLVIDFEKMEGEEHLGRTVVALKRAYPLEASVVGIPSNRRGWVQQAIKSLVERGALLLDCNETGCRPYLQATIPSLVDKEGRRNSMSDMARLQMIHDMSMELGAECPMDEEEEKHFRLDNLVLG